MCFEMVKTVLGQKRGDRSYSSEKFIQFRYIAVAPYLYLRKQKHGHNDTARLLLLAKLSGSYRN